MGLPLLCVRLFPNVVLKKYTGNNFLLLLHSPLQNEKETSLSYSLQRVMGLFLRTGKIHAAFNKICGITIFIPPETIPKIIATINFHFSSLLVCKVANQLYFPTPYKIFQLYFQESNTYTVTLRQILSVGYYCNDHKSRRQLITVK